LAWKTYSIAITRLLTPFKAETRVITESVQLVSIRCKVGYQVDPPNHMLRREYTANELSVIGAWAVQAVVDVSL